MAVEYMSYVWKKEEDVRGTRLLLLLAYADYADQRGSSYSSVRHMAKKIRSSESTVRNLTSELVSAHKLIKIEGDGIETASGKTNRVYVVAPGINCHDYHDLCKRLKVNPVPYMSLPQDKRGGNNPEGINIPLQDRLNSTGGLNSTPQDRLNSTGHEGLNSTPNTLGDTSGDTSLSDTLAGAPVVREKRSPYSNSRSDQDPTVQGGKVSQEGNTVIEHTALELTLARACHAKGLTEAMCEQLRRPGVALLPGKTQLENVPSPHELWDQDALYQKWITEYVARWAKQHSWNRSETVGKACKLQDFYNWRADQYDESAAQENATTRTSDQRFDPID